MKKEMFKLSSIVIDKINDSKIEELKFINGRFIIKKNNGTGKAILPSKPSYTFNSKVKYCDDTIEIEQNHLYVVIDLEEDDIRTNTSYEEACLVLGNVLSMLEVVKDAQ